MTMTMTMTITMTITMTLHYTTETHTHTHTQTQTTYKYTHTHTYTKNIFINMVFRVIGGFLSTSAKPVKMWERGEGGEGEGEGWWWCGGTLSVGSFLRTWNIFFHTQHTYTHNKAPPHHITCRALSQWGRQLETSFSTF